MINKKIKKYLLELIIFLAIIITGILAISFAFFRVDTDYSELDAAPDKIIVPDYNSDIWFKGQGYPIKYQLLKEGWTDLEGGGEIFILPNVLTKLPYKNLEESEEWVKSVNSSFNPNPLWSYDSRRRKGNYRCMSQAASTISDWHALLLGNELRNYKSIYTGQTERGLNYKILDSIYYQRAKQDPKNYKLNTRKLMQDPVSHTPVPFSLSGYAQILSVGMGEDSDQFKKIPDYNLLIIYSYSSDDFHIYSNPITLFKNKAFWEIIFKKEPKLTQKTKEALHKHGILYGGIKARFSMLNGNLKKTKLGFIPLSFFSGHGVSIVGYIEKSGHTYFVFRETFGLANEETEKSGVAYRMFPIYGFNEIYAFSQPLDINVNKLSPTEFSVVVHNAEGKNVDLQIGKEITSDNANAKISALGDEYLISTKDRTKLTISKDYFYTQDGMSYSFDLN